MAKDKTPEAPANAAPEEAAAAAPKRKLVIPKAAIYAAVVLGMTVGSYFLQKAFLFPDGAGTASAAPAKKPEKKKSEAAETNVVMLDEIIVNPAETSGRRYLAVTIGLETHLPETDKSMEKKRPVIRDALIGLLSSKHLDELSRISYRDSLKEELREAVNRQLHDSLVTAIVFSGYVLQ